MEHLPWRDQLPRARPAVPFLCADSEDDICNSIEDFSSWPTRKGWDLTSPTSPEAAKWCQAWLFFGFLRIMTESLGQTFSVETYVSEHNSGVLDSRPVTELIATVRRKLLVTNKYNPLKDTSLSPFGHDLYRMLKETLEAHCAWIIRNVQECEAQHEAPDPWTVELFNVFWSALLLFELFCDFGGGHNVDIKSASAALPALTRKTRTLSGALLIFRRCPTILNRTDLSPMKAYNLLTIPISTNFDHTQCRDWYCKALNVDPHNYQMQHDEQCKGRCPITRISLQCLENLIEKNLIPLVRSSIDDASGSLTVDIVDGTHVEDYTAVSHVWARGLGNFDENAHFYCQLRQLHIDIFNQRKTWYNRHGGCVHYWIDTLCIPTQEGTLKTKAINSMATIYAGAHNVLVIDSELRLLDSRGLSPREAELAIFCSPWMGRSWTLQEGALGVNVYIRFKDRLASLAKLGVHTELIGSTLVQGLWKRDVDRLEPNSNRAFFSIFKRILIPRSDPITPREKFLTVWNDLCYRSTTKSEDIAAILAVFLDRSAGEVLSLPPDQRMQALLRTQESLPLSILFSPINTRSTMWSPAFPTSQSHRDHLQHSLGDMEFSQNGHFVLSDLTGIEILHCYQDIIVHGQITIYDEVQDRCYHIYFEDVAFKTMKSTYTNILLLFATYESNDYGISEGRGISCINAEDSRDGLQAQFLKGFRWVCHKTECNASVNVTDLQGHTISPRCTRTTDYRVASPIGEGHFTHEYQLILDMGVQPWPELKWSRQEFYPFLDTSIRIATPLNLSRTLAFTSCLYIGFYFLSGIGVNVSHTQRDIYFTVIYVLIGIIYICCRWYLAKLEHGYFRQWSHRTLQTKWANSFLIPNNNEDGRSSRNTRRIIFLVLIYGTLLISSTTGWTVILVRYLRSRGPLAALANLSVEISESPVLILVKPVCLTVSGELLARILVIILLFSPQRTKKAPAIYGTNSNARDRRALLGWLFAADVLFVGLCAYFWAQVSIDIKSGNKFGFELGPAISFTGAICFSLCFTWYLLGPHLMVYIRKRFTRESGGDIEL